MHSSITIVRVLAACGQHNSSLDGPGFCKNCRADAEGVEPDARNYECELCGAFEVFGAEEMLMAMM